MSSSTLSGQALSAKTGSIYLGAPSDSSRTVITGTLSGQNTFTVPAITGSAIVSAGAQTLTGDKTFSSGTYAKFGATASMRANGSALEIIGDTTLSLDASTKIVCQATTEIATGRTFTVGTRLLAYENTPSEFIIRTADTGTPAKLKLDAENSYIYSSAAHSFDNGVYFGAPTAVNWTQVVGASPSGHSTVTIPARTGTVILTTGTQTIAGDATFSGTIVVPTPTLASQAATKDYVDTMIPNLDYHTAVMVASTANVPLTGSVPLTIDGTTVANGDRILLKDQTLAQNNGIYVATVSGTYTLTRATDADVDGELTTGSYVFTSVGTVNSATSFVLATAAPIVIGTTLQTWEIFVVAGLTDPTAVQTLSNKTLVDPKISGAIVFDTGSQADVKIDFASPVDGWTDVTCNVTVRGTGANDPTYATFRGNIRGYEFPGSGSSLREVWAMIHIPHQYAVGNGIYFHVHWAPNVSGATGNIKWNFEYSYAKMGDAFPAATTVSIVNAMPAQYVHTVTEIASPILAANLEVDGVILVRVYRNAADAQDTSTASAFLFFIDCHLPINKYATKYRNKDIGGSFY